MKYDTNNFLSPYFGFDTIYGMTPKQFKEYQNDLKIRFITNPKYKSNLNKIINEKTINSIKFIYHGFELLIVILDLLSRFSLGFKVIRILLSLLITFKFIG